MKRVILAFLITLVLNVAAIWAISSVGVSALKRVSGSCDELWSADKYVGTEWFCPVRK